MIDEQQQNNIYKEIVENLNGLNYKHVNRKILDENLRMVEVIFITIYYSQMEKLLDIAKKNNAIFLIEPIDSLNVRIILH